MSDASMEQNWCKWPEYDWKRFVECQNKLIAAERAAAAPPEPRIGFWDAVERMMIECSRDIPDEMTDIFRQWNKERKAKSP